MKLATTDFMGYLEYHPWMILSDAERSMLRRALVEHKLASSPENPRFPLDWRIWDPGVTSAEVILYADGDDSGKAGVLFYRREKGLGMIHVPGKKDQRRLWEFQMQLWGKPYFRSFPAMQEINLYLESVLNTEGAWIPVEIKA